MKEHKSVLNIKVLFVLIQSLLYVSFLTIDFSNGDVALSSYLKFTVIILCFCYALLSKGNDKSILFCLKTAMFFTLISDLFLLLLDYYIAGVLTFIIVQQLYGLRLSMIRHDPGQSQRKKKIITGFLLRLLSLGCADLILCLILKQLGVEPDALLVASIFYFGSILTNTVWAITAAASYRREKGILIFAAGMTLFLLCDINVGLFNLSGVIRLPDQVYHTVDSISSMLMWVFYAPSQVLISLSIKES